MTSVGYLKDKVVWLWGTFVLILHMTHTSIVLNSASMLSFEEQSSHVCLMLNGPLQFSFSSRPLLLSVDFFSHVVAFLPVHVLGPAMLYRCVFYIFLMLMITFKCDGLIRFVLDWSKFPNVIKVCHGSSVCADCSRQGRENAKIYVG